MQVLDAYIADLSLRVGDDRHLSTAWRTGFLLRKHNNGYKPRKSKQTIPAEKNGLVLRVTEEYFIRDKVNIACTHNAQHVHGHNQC